MTRVSIQEVTRSFICFEIKANIFICIFSVKRAAQAFCTFLVIIYQSDHLYRLSLTTLTLQILQMS
jgi:hypothetical protein